MFGFLINFACALLNLSVGLWAMSVGGDPTISFIFAGVSTFFALFFLALES